MKFDLNNREFYWFYEIGKIPHCSKHEKNISNFIKDFAIEHSLRYKQDSMYNIIVYKPAAKGCENAAPLILQGHLDMVAAVEQGYTHDFTKEPLDLYVDEEGWLHARHTSLGADDGIGIAQMLAVLEDDSLKSPPLECIFTVCEELDMDGARKLNPEDIQADRLITLDCMDLATAELCSCGGCTSTAEFTLAMKQNADPVYTLQVSGLQGGHSGADIHRERGNAIKIIARILTEASLSGCDIRLVSIDGGDADNAIPVRTEGTFASATPMETLQEQINLTMNEIKNEFIESESNIQLSFEKTQPVQYVSANGKDLIDFLYLMPNGFQHRSMKIPGLTYTSLNIGIIRTEGSAIKMEILLRSVYLSAMADLNRQLSLLAEKTGITFKPGYSFSGWNYNPVSPLREKYRIACSMHGKTLQEKAEHGGLEAGIFSGLHPGIDIVTVGAECTGYHTPREKLNLASYHQCYCILRTLLELCTND